MDLSEKQLLLLSEYMYLPDVTIENQTIGETIESFKDESGNFKPELLAQATGGVTVEEAEEFLKEIEKDETLMNLKVVESKDTGIRACCFVDSRNPDSNEAVLAFRGTGGDAIAWADNFRGVYQSETMMQQEAAQFVADQCMDYDISYATGHSKGGNLAEFVTIMFPDLIDKCTTFDAQGFSKYFHDMYKAAIEGKADDMTNISSYKDPVNTLLKPVSGTIKYIATDPDIKGFDNHKTSTLDDNSYFDANGNYKDEVLTDRSLMMNGLHLVADEIVQAAPMNVKRGIGDVIGPLVGAFVSGFKDVLSLPVEIFKGLTNQYKTKPLELDENSKMLPEDKAEIVEELTTATKMYLEGDDRLSKMKKSTEHLREGRHRTSPEKNQNGINIEDSQINININIEGSQVYNEMEGALTNDEALVSAIADAVSKNMREDVGFDR